MAIPGADVDEEGSDDERQAISEGLHGGPNGEESHQKGRQGQRGYTAGMLGEALLPSWKLPMLTVFPCFFSLPKIMANVIAIDL